MPGKWGRGDPRRPPRLGPRSRGLSGGPRVGTGWEGAFWGPPGTEVMLGEGPAPPGGQAAPGGGVGPQKPSRQGVGGHALNRRILGGAPTPAAARTGGEAVKCIKRGIFPPKKSQHREEKELSAASNRGRSGGGNASGGAWAPLWGGFSGQDPPGVVRTPPVRLGPPPHVLWVFFGVHGVSSILPWGLQVGQGGPGGFIRVF